jgi:adenine deaminase
MKKISKEKFEQRIDVARGLKPCETVLRGAKWLDVFSGKWLSGDIAIDDGVIVGVGEHYDGKKIISLKRRFLVPGFIDSHLHLESTMMVPEEFEATVLPRGTTSAIVDPHEIVNVLGKSGLKYILDCAEKAQMDLFVMLSSCVPATHLETSGARMTASDLLPFKNYPNVLGLAEMMNYPGLLNKDPEVLEKIYEFQDVHIDGHAPTLRGKDLNAYLSCGIKSCHESVTKDEAQEKLERGMQVMLREGSVAKNLKELVGVLTPFSSPNVSLATDDRNPADILDEGHIDYLIRLALKRGASVASVYRAASLSTARCFGIKNLGALAPGYKADIVVLKDFKKCLVDRVFKNGILIEKQTPQAKKNAAKTVARTKTENGFVGSWHVEPPRQNSMLCKLPQIAALKISGNRRQTTKVRVIGIVPNNIVTEDLRAKLSADSEGFLKNDLKNDILKIAVIERHGKTQSTPSVAFVKGLGIKKGAIGSSVGHDSHNAVVIGTNDQDMLACFTRLKELGGGFVVACEGKIMAELALPIAGLMTEAPLKEIYTKLKLLRRTVRKLGCKLDDAFLQMAFLCLPVIPDLKITDRGLVDVRKFDFVSVLVEKSTDQNF